MFSKIFETQEHGQILVKADQTDTEVPEIRFFFRNDQQQITSTAVLFDKTSAGCMQRDQSFAEIQKLAASSIVEKSKLQLGI